MYMTNEALICIKPWVWKVLLHSYLIINCIAVGGITLQVCDSNAPWSTLWTDYNSYKCYKNGALKCSDECVDSLLNVGLKVPEDYEMLKDDDCSCNSTRTKEDCYKSQKFVWECYLNDCVYHIDWSSIRCSSDNCTEDCLADNIALYRTDLAVNKSLNCNCYRHPKPAEDKPRHCDSRRSYIKSCYDLYVSHPSPPAHPFAKYWWALILGLMLVVLLVLVGLCVVKPPIFNRWIRNKDTLEMVGHFIVWNDVTMISKKDSKEVVLKVPYRKDNKTKTTVLKIFESYRGDVFFYESEIHDKIKNVHKNIIEVYGKGEINGDLLCKLANKYNAIQRNSKSWYLMLRHCSQGSLYAVLHNKDLSLYRVLKVGLDICSALQYLQKLRIIHMDIKSLNIFVTGSLRCLLGDFGMAVEWIPTDDTVYCPRTGKRIVQKFEPKGGTYPYYPPEYIRKGRVYVLKDVIRDPFKIDVYQLGLLLWDCQTPRSVAGSKRRPPYDKEMEQYRGTEKASRETMATLFENKPCCRPLFHDNSDQSIVNIIEKCWNTNVEDRPMSSELYRELELALVREMIKSRMCCTSYNPSICDAVEMNRIVSVVHAQTNVSVSPDVEVPYGKGYNYQI